MLDTNPDFASALAEMEQTSHSIFITGRAGTGKSTLLKQFRDTTQKNVVVLAPTGVAAVNVGGVTIHSFFHFKPDITGEKARALAASSRSAQMYRALDTILIDEISMVRADLLDCIDIFLRRVCGSDEPFGGKQMIFFGDLYQLPPVTTSQDIQLFQSLVYDTPYFFGANVMSQLDLHHHELTHIYRQTDPEFIDLLGNIRNNTLTEDDLELLNRRVNPDYLPPVDEMVVYLTTTNYLADGYNASMLRELTTETASFQAKTEGHFDAKSSPVPSELTLKIGAQVMLTHNDPDGQYINGTMAKILSFNGS